MQNKELSKVAIHSVPRSGSSWLGSIFDSHPKVAYRFQPLFSYTHKNSLSENSSVSDIHNFFGEILNTSDNFVLQKEAIRLKKIPEFQKKDASHIVYKEVRYHNILQNLLRQDSDLRIVGLIRNPFATLSSWLNAPKEFKKELGWKVREEWRFAPQKNQNKPEEFNGYEKWKEAAFLFLKLKEEYPDRFYLVDYNVLLTDKVAEVEKLFNFCGLEMTAQTKEFLNKSSEKNDKDAYSVFKQKSRDDKWKDELPEFIIDEIKADKDFQELNKIFKWI